MEEYEQILIENLQETAQVDGFGRGVEEIFLKLKVNGLIKETETRKFMIEVTMRVKDTAYQYTNIFTRESMNEEGYISVGTVYVRGPVQEDEIVYSGKITFITT